MFTLAIGVVVGVALGAAGYRYLWKHDPAKLEAWAERIRQARDELDA
jgi:hypothetical protein